MYTVALLWMFLTPHTHMIVGTAWELSHLIGRRKLQKMSSKILELEGVMQYLLDVFL